MSKNDKKGFIFFIVVLFIFFCILEIVNIKTGPQPYKSNTTKETQQMMDGWINGKDN